MTSVTLPLWAEKYADKNLTTAKEAELEKKIEASNKHIADMWQKVNSIERMRWRIYAKGTI